MNKEIYLKVTFNDEDGYKGHGDDTSEIIRYLLEREMEMELENDDVIKEGWKVEIVDFPKIN